MDFIANHRIFTQEELNFIQTEKFNNEFVGKSNEKEFERYLKDTNDLYADKIEYTKSIVKELFGIVDIFRISHLGIIYICSDSIGQYFDARSVLYRYGKFLKQKRQAIQNKFTSIDKDKFLEIIQEFLDKVDELRPTGKTIGSMPTQFEKSMNEVLQNLDYVCNFSFGQGILSSVPFINFCPKNILNKDLVNGDKLSGRRGIYIGFGYDYNKQKLDLVIGYGNNDTQECEAKNKIDKYRPNEWKYTYKRDEFGKIKDQIVKDFLNLVSEFNQIPIEYFKPKGAEVIQQTNKSANETNGVPPLNQILYGPPGTGKTYNTINKALEILGVETQGKSRAELKAQFDKFRQNGQIEFVTFHQSFSYEEFVEGIKPNIENENTEMTYEVKDGIFKDISDRALSNYQAHKDSLQNLPHKESNTKELFQAFAQNLQEQLTDAENGIDFNTPSLSTKMQISKVFYFKNEEAKSIAISVPNSKSNQVLKRDLVLRDYEKFKSGEIQSYKDIKPTYESLAQWHGNAIYYFALYEKIAEFEKSYKPQNQAVSEVKLKPYILIIDEINRGNISKILGELITLIEPSKRIGADEELRVSLPYSTNEFDGGNGFGVPSNLYIIGTMNTADRSIALLDTALRRRFEFVEMISQPELLKNIWIVKDTEQRDNENLVIPKNRMEELDEYMSEKSNCLYQILNSINNRIEFLLDREHTIGHAFFFEKAKFYKNDKMEWYELTLESLKEIFVKKIIPLLQEYFYDDYAKIDAVLNGNKMIEITEVKVSSLFSKKDKDLELDDKKIYKITPFENEIWDNPQTYKNIYVGKESNSQEISENEQE